MNTPLHFRPFRFISQHRLVELAITCLGLWLVSFSFVSAAASTNDLFVKWPWESFNLKEAREIWDAASVKSNIVVAVVESGFVMNHPALSNKLWKMPGQPNVHGRDFSDEDWDPSTAPGDHADHGTMVAGIIGGSADLAEEFAGVAPDVDLMLLRIWGSAEIKPRELTAALRFAISNDARVVNMSFNFTATNGEFADLPELRNAFKAAETNGLLIVVSAPNESSDMDTVTNYVPGNYPFTNIIQVTGLGLKRHHYSYPNYAGFKTRDQFDCIVRFEGLSGAWGRKNVDIAAPLEGILAPTYNGGYRRDDATSYAAPLVTGAAALVWGLMPKLNAGEVRCLLLRGARQISYKDVFLNRSKPHPSNHRGGSMPPDNSWGHEPPARPGGLLDLSFLGEAHKRYLAGKEFPGCFKANVRNR